MAKFSSGPTRNSAAGVPKVPTIFEVLGLQNNHFKLNYYQNKSVLITTQNFEWTNAQLNTDVFLNIEILFKKIFHIIDNLPEKIDLIIKIHPAKDPYNEFLKERIKKINPNIQILQSEPSRLLIANCDVLVNIHSELIPFLH